MNRPATLLLVLAVEAAAVDGSICGLAFGLETDTLEYRELHYELAQGRRIEYRDVQGELIAVNELAYGNWVGAPDHRQSDFRRGMELGSRWQGNRLLLFNTDASKVLTPGEPVVVSAGFDAFVRENWSPISAGGRLVFDFPLPRHLRTICLAIERIDPEGSVIEDLRDDWTVLRISADGFFQRLLVGTIDLAYDGQRLLRVYQGPSNLSTETGRGLKVAIRYLYGDEYRQSAACMSIARGTTGPGEWSTRPISY